LESPIYFTQNEGTPHKLSTPESPHHRTKKPRRMPGQAGRIGGLLRGIGSVDLPVVLIRRLELAISHFQPLTALRPDNCRFPGRFVSDDGVNLDRAKAMIAWARVAGA
jgi:hypothetical protein